jgi:hypothetical protein
VRIVEWREVRPETFASFKDDSGFGQVVDECLPKQKTAQAFERDSMIDAPLNEGLQQRRWVGYGIASDAALRYAFLGAAQWPAALRLAFGERTSADEAPTGGLFARGAFRAAARSVAATDTLSYFHRPDYTAKRQRGRHSDCGLFCGGDPVCVR